MSKKRIQIEDIQPLEESFKAPDGYFDSLLQKIEANRESLNELIKLSSIPRLEESYQAPEGYFEGLMDRIEERKSIEANVVAFRSRRIKILGSMVAAACIAIVVLSVVNFGPSIGDDKVDYSSVINIPDHEIASLMEDRDDEFQLTEEEIIEAIEYVSLESESTAIIDFLQEDGDLESVEDEADFLESI